MLFTTSSGKDSDPHSFTTLMSQLCRNKKQRRDALELEQLFARDPLTDDESGAFSITSLLSKFLRREELEMLARQDESGAFTLKLRSKVSLVSPFKNNVG